MMKRTRQVETSSPTDEFYGLLQFAFDHFNAELFEGKLPKCLITVQREKNTMGYFSPERWGNQDGKRAHEISINPAYFANHKIVEILQTIVHEQCHLWQHVYGKHKSRPSYHNNEWADKMEGIGLVPSHDGKEGGKRTGQKMADYPAPNGKFLESCRRLVKNRFKLNWIDRVPAISEPSQQRIIRITAPLTQSELLLDARVSTLIPDLIPVSETARKKAAKSKNKYSCPNCGSNVWGKPNMNVRCDDCEQRFTEITPGGE